MLRITGGEFCGRTILTPKNERTRPTQAKLRQALFNSLQSRIAGARVLDLFAGSGSLGFEALSRGAEEVVFVESARQVQKLIHQNSETLGVENKVHVLGESVQSALSKVRVFGPFEIILADPPYEEGWEMKLLTDWPWDELISEGGVLCLEWGLKKSIQSQLPERTPFLLKTRERIYGDSVLSTYALESNPKEV